MRLDRAGLEVLETEQCLALLSQVELGRVAVSVGAVPAIFPVNFGMLDGSVVFRTGEGTKLAAASRNAVVAFEADAIHSALHRGWSVMIVGMAEEILDPAELDRVALLGLQPWASGPHEHVVRIKASQVSGRRIVADMETLEVPQEMQ